MKSEIKKDDFVKYDGKIYVCHDIGKKLMTLKLRYSFFNVEIFKVKRLNLFDKLKVKMINWIYRKPNDGFVVNFKAIW